MFGGLGWLRRHFPAERFDFFERVGRAQSQADEQLAHLSGHAVFVTACRQFDGKHGGTRIPKTNVPDGYLDREFLVRLREPTVLIQIPSNTMH